MKCNTDVKWIQIMGSVLLLKQRGYMHTVRAILKIYFSSYHMFYHIWVDVFKNGPNKICGRQPLKNLK